MSQTSRLRGHRFATTRVAAVAAAVTLLVGIASSARVTSQEFCDFFPSWPGCPR
jgi:hypothetical protein